MTFWGTGGRVCAAAALVVVATISTGCASSPPPVKESVQKYYDENVKGRTVSSSSTDAPNVAPLQSSIKAGKTVTVYGLGSSVGKGATLPNPSAEAPAAHLAAKLKPLTKGGATATNLSVNGSVASQGVAIYRAQIKPKRPTVLVLAYGMNDGMTAAYNSGQTLTGGIAAIREISAAAKADGTTVLIATTPGPHMGRTDFALPEGLPVMFPKAGGLAEPVEPSVTVNGVPFSARHAQFNKEVRALAAELKVDVLDVEPSWTKAVETKGEDALFDPQETVHPNLAGHTASYWAAIDTFAANLKD